MYTYSYSWKVWKSPKLLASGQNIFAYLKEAAEEEGIMDKIRFNAKVQKAEWFSSKNQWQLELSNGERYSCNLLLGCTGYYSHDFPYEPKFQNQEHFAGEIVHSQKYTQETDDKIVNKKVAIIGSGATAITILPKIANVANQTTLIQRTPSYVFSIPGRDPTAEFFNKYFPLRMVSWINWLKTMFFVLFFTVFNQFCVWFPKTAKNFVKNAMFKEVQSRMTREEFEKHFSPPYNPFQQRLCLTPDGEFFEPIRNGRSSIVTGQVDRFTKHGMQMKDGTFVEADIVILATGLNLQDNFPFSTIKVELGHEYDCVD